MKAAMYYGIGDVRVVDVPKPKAGPGEIVMQNISALTCGTELKQYRRGYPSFKEGEVRRFGHESSGIVAEVGEGVTKFKVGDRIATHNSAPCNSCYFCRVGQHSMCENLVFSDGSWAEYRLLPAEIVKQNVFLLPDNISYRSAALLEPLSCAVYCINEANVQLMDIVVINGAGPLGLMNLKVAKLRGAYTIISDLNPKRLEFAKQLGADATIEVSKVDDQVRAVRELTPDGRGVDIAIDATGLPEMWEKNLYMVRKGGTVMEFGGCKSGTTITIDTRLLHYDQITVKGLFHTTPRYVEQAFRLIERGYISEDVFVGGTYSLDHCIDALESHARGEVVKNEIRCF
ncbi:MAG: zinc-binding dehydrogenase [Anaerolineaceae bacterium]